ncbi:hypothetical protein BJX66DRAFT_341701 [Aspergillus keveii]|uniref:F-box domain protein n=1 Tax=Aspergillus keveii TaxID=714993 RepID=A0ABR4FUG7_9EURO
MTLSENCCDSSITGLAENTGGDRPQFLVNHHHRTSKQKKTRSLASLSPEFLLSILQSLDSPKDLYSAIAASSHLYRVFASYQRSTTAAILRRAITTHIERDFITAYRAQEIWRYVPEYNDDPYCPKDVFDLEGLRTKTASVLEESTTREPYDLDSLISDHEVLPELWMFYRNFEHFILKYATSALQDLSPSTFTVPQLSISEKTRLKRAFFRCEVYTCLFQLSQLTDRGWRSSRPLTDPAPTYIQRLPSWEIEQVYCVLQSYMTIVEQICDRMEDEFISLVRANQLAYHPPVGYEWMSTVDVFLDYYCISWYDDSERYERRIHNAYIVSRGTLAMWKLTHIPFATARKVIIKTVFTGVRQPSIVSDLEHLRRQYGSEDIPDSDGCSTFAWSWAGGNATYHRPYGLPVNYELRNQGYVFWDETRLKEIPLFCAPRAQVTSWTELPQGYKDHEKSPGVVARLGNARVFKEVIGMVVDEILDRSKPKDDEDGVNIEDAEDGEPPRNPEDPEPVPYVIHWRD